MILVQCENHSSKLSMEKVDEIVRALSIQGTHHIAPAWSMEGVSVQRRVRSPIDWTLAFLENSDQAGALGYHDDINGLPLMRVFVQDCLSDGVSPSACASHELAEAMVDPDLIRATVSSQGRAWACEVGDPAQASTYEIAGIEVQDFVTPNWFADEPAGDKFDHTGKITAPFEVPSGGYAQFTTDLRNWQQIGSELGAGHARPDLRRATLIPGQES